MQNDKHGITCSVCDCCYNVDGKECKKQSVCISCGEKGCTQCASYQSDVE